MRYYRVSLDYTRAAAKHGMHVTYVTWQAPAPANDNAVLPALLHWTKSFHHQLKSYLFQSVSGHWKQTDLFGDVSSVYSLQHVTK